MKINKPIVFIDIAVTGLSVASDKIVKISLKKFSNDAELPITKVYLINPSKEISEAAVHTYGITNHDVKDEPRFAEIMEEVRQDLNGRVLIGYDIKEFELPFLCEEFHREKSPLILSSYEVVDLKQIYFKMEPRDLLGAYHFYNDSSKKGDKQKVDLLQDIFIGQCSRYKDYTDYPVTLLELAAEYVDNSILDLAGKFVMTNNHPCITFGKHAGASLQYIEDNDPSYISWMLSSDIFTEDTKSILRKYTSVEE